ncbi:DNA-binding response OmpR family regulator [Pedobacter cryoconitis]|uniref:DNA-binding response OmpR family regulator n=1 Tax=Pedobacter cryoconitis TaxID=188932 RepID=A0A7W9E1R0_9SPHI|nr:response regulator transcription factor [Pedobacter cryoconitis]MBB5639366.1 DNA-binding response OmpR family regulator [Pedobacter cryoconitis]MBB6274217.1 DNA-binding response OmpR family regulator [Pedobacter cryoconitis]
MSKLIQIIEDDEAIRDVIEYILQQSEFDVTVASNAREFKINLFNTLPDLILMDVKLPDGNGIQLCRKLKQSLDTRHIPVIIISAHATAEESSKEAFADDFISKPFDLDDLLKRIENQLA